ncbi:MAG: ABC transporter permease [Bryobacteraceae bacterium]|nr:ABC transporter permease [Bryobacteraceae bacterium]
MSAWDLLVDTVRTLWAHKLRTALTMFGIAWGIVSITLMVAAGEGLRVGQEKVAEQFGKNIMIVFAGRTSMQAGGMRAGRAIRWRTWDYQHVQREATSCEFVIPELGSGGKVKSDFNSALLQVVGSLPPFAHIRTIDIAEGRFYNWGDVERAERVAVLGSDSYTQLFAGRKAVGEQILVRGVPFTVIGVMKAKDQDSSYDGRDITKVFIPFTTMARDFPREPPSPRDAIDRLIASPKSLELHERCKYEVRRALGRLHSFDPTDEEAAGIWDTVENSKQFRTMTDGIKYFLGGVGLITLLLGGLGVMNVMLVAVRERTQEIGVRKAVGATSRAILRYFFLETMIVVLLSGGIGLAVGFGICAAVNRLPMPAYFAGLLPTWGSAMLSFLLLGLTAILSALYPASRAAAVDPIVALRHEPGS